MSIRLVRVPASDRKRVLIFSDVTNEADDPFAIAHALLSPSLEARGIVATHYVRPGTMEESYAAALELAEIMGSDAPVLRGAEGPLETLGQDAPLSEGARFLIDEALAPDSRPLYVLVFGAITEVAEALRENPSIAERIIVVFVGGAPYPEGGREANLSHDLVAAREVFASPVELWQLTSAAYSQMTVSIAWLARHIAPLGKLGMHLFDRVVDFAEANSCKFWVRPENWHLGDNVAVAAVLFDGCMPYETRVAPAIGEGGVYEEGTGREIRVYEKVDARLIVDDLVAKLELFEEGLI
ncbi:MAG: nucleoside hydrolase [Atopobiaceae bacterium]|jgi:inosine-uridine nucleoside N-ribohydrolase|nr:nucleoside hydrolase [Atopobiaceae bacterium]MCI2051502.1 nucleoside hydrolase [Atopobiaceae bacterium]